MPFGRDISHCKNQDHVLPAPPGAQEQAPELERLFEQGFIAYYDKEGKKLEGSLDSVQQDFFAPIDNEGARDNIQGNHRTLSGNILLSSVSLICSPGLCFHFDGGEGYSEVFDSLCELRLEGESGSEYVSFTTCNTKGYFSLVFNPTGEPIINAENTINIPGTIEIKGVLEGNQYIVKEAHASNVLLDKMLEDGMDFVFADNEETLALLKQLSKEDLRFLLDQRPAMESIFSSESLTKLFKIAHPGLRHFAGAEEAVKAFNLLYAENLAAEKRGESCCDTEGNALDTYNSYLDIIESDYFRDSLYYGEEDEDHKKHPLSFTGLTAVHTGFHATKAEAFFETAFPNIAVREKVKARFKMGYFQNYFLNNLVVNINGDDDWVNMTQSSKYRVFPDEARTKLCFETYVPKDTSRFQIGKINGERTDGSKVVTLPGEMRAIGYYTENEPVYEKIEVSNPLLDAMLKQGENFYFRDDAATKYLIVQLPPEDIEFLLGQEIIGGGQSTATPPQPLYDGLFSKKSVIELRKVLGVKRAFADLTSTEATSDKKKAIDKEMNKLPLTSRIAVVDSLPNAPKNDPWFTAMLYKVKRNQASKRVKSSTLEDMRAQKVIAKRQANVLADRRERQSRSWFSRPLKKFKEKNVSKEAREILIKSGETLSPKNTSSLIHCMNAHDCAKLATTDGIEASLMAQAKRRLINRNRELEAEIKRENKRMADFHSRGPYVTAYARLPAKRERRAALKRITLAQLTKRKDKFFYLVSSWFGGGSRKEQECYEAFVKGTQDNAVGSSSKGILRSIDGVGHSAKAPSVHSEDEDEDKLAISEVDPASQAYLTGGLGRMPSPQPGF